jgi:hypothetical protein
MLERRSLVGEDRRLLDVATQALADLGRSARVTGRGRRVVAICARSSVARPA